MSELSERIRSLKAETDTVILAHYYVDGAVQEVADYVGDSYYLAKVATKVPQKTILFCGVHFMGESAKLLNPQKTVLLADAQADCPMAHMASIENIKKLKNEYEDLAVVCYINSTAELKMHADVCVTSSNALKIVKALPNKNIYFIPDENLGRHIAGMVPEKHFIFNDGYCPVHKKILKEQVEAMAQKHPEAEILVHPECTQDVTALADYAGSTAGIIDYAKSSAAGEFIVCTETGVFYDLEQECPGKRFYEVAPEQICPDMKKITLEKIIAAMEQKAPVVEMDTDMIEKANAPLIRMLELAK